MSAEAKQEVVLESPEMFQEGLTQTKIETTGIKYLQNNDISKERKDENEMLKEDIGFMLGDESNQMVFELPDGQFMVIRQTVKNVDKLDKQALSQHVGIPVEEMKTPLDFSMLTAQGKLAPATIANFIEKVPQKRVTVRKVKNNPNKLKDKKKKYGAR